jgi:hypothetical protein
MKRLYHCPIVMTLEFSRQIFEKSGNIKFHGNTSTESRADLSGKVIDGRTESFLQFFKGSKN